MNYYHYFCAYVPYVSQSKITFFNRIVNSLKEGNDLIDVFKALSVNLISPRKKYVCKFIYNKLLEGYDFINLAKRFPALFPESTVNMFEILVTSGSSVSLVDVLNVQLAMLKRETVLFNKVVLPNIGLSIMSIGVFVGIDMNTDFHLRPIYDFVKTNVFIRQPAGLVTLIKSLDSFKLILIPISLSLCSLPIIASILKSRFLKAIPDFFICFVPPFNLILGTQLRLAFIEAMELLISGGVMLQSALVISLEIIKNDFMYKNHLNCIKKMYQGHSIVSSFSQSKLLSSSDLDTLFSSTDQEGLLTSIASVKKKFLTRENVIFQFVNTFLRLFFLGFITYWLVTFGFAWISVLLRLVRRPT